MFDFQQMYREKLRTPEAAVECVKDGDWVDYTSSLGKPVLLDRALAPRRLPPSRGKKPALSPMIAACLSWPVCPSG